ncbi:MAG: MBL fold metallo-hydrolase [Clostridia bacterium]|nr:MBL fold metallo-hydrolase [Clostridia bacterium]
MNVEIKTIALGELATNCLLLVSESGETAVVDPAVYDENLMFFLEENNVSKLDYILLTHGHFDHISGIMPLKKRYGGKIVIHEKDERCFQNSEYSLLSQFGVSVELPEKADIVVTDGSVLPFGEDEIKVIHTPGHTAGSVCYLLNRFLIAGDTLFYMSMGRTDFPGGNVLQMASSLKKLCELDGDYFVWCGHGESTSLDFERKNNPYCVASRGRKNI